MQSLIVNIATLTSWKAVESAVVEGAASLLAEHLPQARISLYLFARPDGQAAVHASAGEHLKGDARLLFSRPLAVRGCQYGKLQVELLDLPRTVSPRMLLTALETVALQLALYAEHLRLQREHSRLKVNLATGKAVARASGVLARKWGIPLAKARAWMQEEAARKGRSLHWLADMLVFGDRLMKDRISAPGLPSERPSPARQDYAA